jgi:hypothetical protein
MLPIVGLLLIAVALAIFGIMYVPAMRLNEMAIPLALAAVGALCTILGFQFRGIGPNFKYYLSYTLTSIFVFGSLAIVFLIVRNHSHEFDLSERSVFSLHPRTKEFLQNLTADIRITAFPPPESKREIEAFLGRYTRFSPRIKYQVRNPYKDVNIAKTFADQINLGDIFIETGKRGEGGQPNSPDFREKKLNAVTGRDLTEAKLTNAIVEVVRPEKITVYFLQGHGEASLEPAGRFPPVPGQNLESYSGVQQLLKDDMSFNVKTLELGRTGFVPDDCSLLICAGPQKDLLQIEAQAIGKYLEGGGRALFLLDPNERPLVRFDRSAELLARFGVKMQNDMVLETNPLTSITGDPTILLVSHFGTHPTVANQSGEMIQMARVRTVAPLENRSTSLTVTALMFSSNRSWSEDIEKLRGSKEIELPEPKRMKEQCLAVAVSMEPSGVQANKGMRLIVIGDSDIFSDRFLRETMRLCANLVNWLVAREDLIDIPTKTLPDTPIFPSAAQLRTVFTLLVLAFPGLIFFGGISYVLVRRRVR